MTTVLGHTLALYRLCPVNVSQACALFLPCGHDRLTRCLHAALAPPAPSLTIIVSLLSPTCFLRPGSSPCLTPFHPKLDAFLGLPATKWSRSNYERGFKKECSLAKWGKQMFSALASLSLAVCCSRISGDEHPSPEYRHVFISTPNVSEYLFLFNVLLPVTLEPSDLPCILSLAT